MVSFGSCLRTTRYMNILQLQQAVRYVRYPHGWYHLRGFSVDDFEVECQG